MLSERDYMLFLASINELGTVSLSALISHFGSAKGVCTADTEEYKLLIPGNMAERLAKQIGGTDIEGKVSAYKQRLSENGFGYMFPEDEGFPERLRMIMDPPKVIFYKGKPEIFNIPHMIAIVGSRQATEYGREAASLIASKLSAAGVVVVSGLAYGIDTAAHKGAINGGGRTIGVSGCGINYIYPRGNGLLYKKMYEEHLVISENGLDIPAFAYNFPLRNRLISGLCQGVVVVEAREKSGSLITADIALMQNRNVYAVPGRMGDPLSAGTNRLIREGATLVDSAEVILEDLFGVSDYDSLIREDTSGKEPVNRGGTEKEIIKMAADTAGSRHDRLQLSESEEKIFAVLSSDPVFIDDIVRMSGVSLAMCIAGLINLKRYGIAVEAERGYYRRCIS